MKLSPWTMLIKREIWEYRNTFVILPGILAGVFLVLMLLSILFAGRLSVIAKDNVEIVIGDGDFIVREFEDSEEFKQLPPPSQEQLREYVQTDEWEREIEAKIERKIEEKIKKKIEESLGVEGDISIDDGSDLVFGDGWDFKDEWLISGGAKFNSKLHRIEKTGSLNAILQVVHIIFLGVLFLVSFAYSLYTLFQDRKDRSVLFWRSMPVSETQSVLVKFFMVIFLVPAWYGIVSVLTQIITLVLALVAVQQFGGEPSELWETLSLYDLWCGQLLMWFVSAFWVAPFYAWILFASAFAKKSPIQVLLLPLIAVALAELWLFGSNVVVNGVVEHIPPMFKGYVAWQNLACSDMLLRVGEMLITGQFWLGLIIAGGFLYGAIYFRNKRIEI